MTRPSLHATEAHVLAAAAALREFALDEITALCDATPSAIVEILATAGESVQMLGPAEPPRWRVVDVAALRRVIRARRHADDAPTTSVPATDADLPAVRLRHAEDLLARCGAESSPARRRSMVVAAVNHLRQVVAGAMPGTPPWWTVEFTGSRLDDDIRWHADGAIAHRLSFDVVVARLAVGNAAGVIVPTADLIDTVVSVRHTVASIDDHCLPALVRGFVELVTAQLAPTTTPAVDRLVVAVARRRVRAKVGANPVTAMGELEPMVRALGSAPDRAPVRYLHETIRQLPDGRDVVVVYADLLPLVPTQYRWQQIGEPLPGALVELVADPSVSEHLSTCATTLESDLARSPYGSDRALIGQTAHVFQRLAEQTADTDGGVILRGNQARSELLDLARPTVWPPPVAAGDDLGVEAAGVSDNTVIRDLTHAALDARGPGTISDLMRVVAEATGCSGAILWEAPDERRGVPTLSVLALWLGPAAADTSRGVAADPITELAYRTRSLAVPADVGPAAVYGRPVSAAVPVDYVDRCHGVLTLMGEAELSAGAFDTAVQMVDVLPELCAVVRERQTLELVNAANRIQRKADLESPDWPLSRHRLAIHLSAVCELVADWLHCPEVATFLFDPASGDRGNSLFAGTANADSSPPTIPDADVVRSGAGVHGEPLLEVRLLRGERLAGLIRCRGTSGPPHHFTASDMALLRPIAAQVSNYWGSWLNRGTIANENESWRGLAAGMTMFNKHLTEGLRLRHDDRHEQLMHDMAVTIVRTVVTESSGVVMYRVEESSTGAPVLRPVARRGHDYRRPPGSSPDTASVSDPMRISRQHSITHPRELAAEGVAEGHGWLLRTPIRAGEHMYGVLEAAGPGTAPPANSEQVHEIISDQVGLYRQLGEMQRRLVQARDNEAAAMEDLKHQLVSPLRTATDRTERLLGGGRFEPGVERQLRAIRGLCRKASRVAMSAGVFATLSRGGRPEPKPERLGADDLVRLLIAVADDAQVLSNPRRRITFEVDRDSVRGMGRRLVNADASFLQQCVGNLLDNAAKYAYPDTRAAIRADLTPTHLSVAVASTGLPLSPRDTLRCLQRNWRGDLARATTGEGSGIGLWIVDSLMTVMGGRVTIEPVDDLTTVRLKLPLV